MSARSTGKRTTKRLAISGTAILAALVGWSEAVMAEDTPRGVVEAFYSHAKARNGEGMAQLIFVVVGQKDAELLGTSQAELRKSAAQMFKRPDMPTLLSYTIQGERKVSQTEYEVTVKEKTKGRGEEKEAEETQTIKVIKHAGKWYVKLEM